ncbi:aldo/keto reductase [Streptococcus hillyeri]|uniref:Aldo/keto reductase n=1 Tax=Streptococcus hillyeri TaxID=2282420 RepID=A0A3L9DU51_9STRE|nr:aldo/keto reductase [Streptococcus hillyeri]RLY04861.1 aldo/keto reductase [Streptococcus hillyeri]
MTNTLITQPHLGVGTWFLGESPHKEKEEIAALQYALSNGVTIVDTAEMYGNGRAETLVGKAIQPFQRDKIHLVSKVLPSNANAKRLEASLDASLSRLKTDYLDLYLYHWRGNTPLNETIDMLEQMKKKGKILNWGVSNFDLEDMQELLELPDGKQCATNQVLYHLGSRGIEYALKPFQDAHQIPTMAYCPLAQAGDLNRRLLTNQDLQALAADLKLNCYQLLLCFTLAQKNMVSIPRSGKLEHMKQLVACQQITLTPKQLDLLNQLFPAPRHRVALDME